MPVVGRHKEDAAVLGIVIAVCARGVARHGRRSVGAGARLEPRHAAIASTREGERRRFLNEVAFADPACAGFLLFDHRMNGTRIDKNEPYRLELHAADAAITAFSLEDVGMHRARPRDIGQLGSRSRCEDKRSDCDRENPRVHQIIVSVAKGTGARMRRVRSQVES
jgi:hypothetical protein